MSTVIDQAQKVAFSEPKSVSDNELVAGMLKGDEAAFIEIVRRYQTSVITFLERMLKNHDKAIDLSQETFIRVFTSVSTYSPNFSFSTYIYRIATNLAISEMRKARRYKFFSIFTIFITDQDEELPLDEPPVVSLSPDEAIFEDERTKAVAAAINSLPDKYRVPAMLRDIDEFDYNEIAQMLNINVGTVKSRIFRARNLLRKRLKDYV